MSDHTLKLSAADAQSGKPFRVVLDGRTIEDVFAIESRRDVHEVPGNGAWMEYEAGKEQLVLLGFRSPELTMIAEPLPADVRGQLFDAIAKERERQDRVHGDNSIAAPRLSEDRRLAVLTEEVGEVAKEANELALGNLSTRAYLPRVIAELVQVAACAIAWAEYATREAEELAAADEGWDRQAEHDDRVEREQLTQERARWESEGR